MKKLVFASLLFLLTLFNSLPPAVSAASPIQVIINGKQLQFPDEKPLLENGRVFVPLRAIQEGFAAKVNWQQQTRKITSIKRSGQQQTTVTYQLGFPYFIQHYHDGGQTEQFIIEKMDVSPKLINNRTMVPLRFATEAMGYKVHWSQQTSTVTINSTSSIKPLATGEQYELTHDAWLSERELDIFFLTNVERKKHGLSPLMLDVAVSEVARLKSQDMYEHRYFAHQSPTYGSPFEMLSDFSITYRLAGENIAYGYPSAQAVVNAWMNSEGHRANILHKGFERIGIGYYGSHYYTQMFITK